MSDFTCPVEKDLSPSLPDGWKWSQRDGDDEWYAENNAGFMALSEYDSIKTWNDEGLLHPSEGGGFQRHTPGDPMPCDGGLEVQVFFRNDDLSGLNGAKALVYPWSPGSAEIIGWRPAGLDGTAP